jgi:hypothetical protein
MLRVVASGNSAKRFSSKRVPTSDVDLSSLHESLLEANQLKNLKTIQNRKN